MFLDRIRQERSRSDRSGKPFTLVLISMGGLMKDGPSASSMIPSLENLSRAVRLYDTLGWYSMNVLGVILPEAGEAEARIVAERLWSRIQPAIRGSDIGCGRGEDIISIMEYPKTLKAALESAGSVQFQRDIEKTEPPPASDRALGFPVASFLENLNRNHNGENGVLIAKADAFARRLMDVCFSLGGFVFFAPLMGLIAALIKITSRGPVLFKQGRIGKDGKAFMFLKFRTMYHNSDQTVHREYVTRWIENNAQKQGERGREYYKLANDRRVTVVGKILRKTSMDELPQLFNVLKGEMSLVGPRPPIGYEVEKYKIWQLRRILEVKPGITGLWQISGRSRTTFDEQVRLDLQYAEKQSFWLNLLIILKTFWAVLSMRGAY